MAEGLEHELSKREPLENLVCACVYMCVGVM